MNGYGRGEDHRDKEKKASFLSRETFGMTLLLFSIVLFVIAAIGAYILGEIGVAITAFLTGVFGFFIYPFLALCVVLSLKLISGKKIISAGWLLRGTAVLCSTFLIVHLATSARFLGAGFGAYLSGCWHAADVSLSGSTGGGAVFGLVVYPVQALLSRVGAYVIFSLLLAVSVFFFLRATPLRKVLSLAPREKKQPAKPKRESRSVRVNTAQPQPYADMGRQGDTDPRGQTYADPAGAQPYADMGRQGYADPRGQSYTDPAGAQPYADTGRNYGAPQNYAGNYDPRQNDRRETYDRTYGIGYGQTAARGGAYDPPYLGFERYTPPAETPSMPTDPRDILFSSDPAANYRNNLLFNSDYANRRRRSSVEPEDSPSKKPEYGIPASYEKPTSLDGKGQTGPTSSSWRYSEQYGAQEPRSPMPRKTVVQNPEPSNARPIDLNYTQIPSYKAPTVDPATEGKQDYYRNDVRFEEDFSSGPNVFDTPPTERAQNEESLRGGVGGIRRAAMTPEPEPLKSEPRAAAPEPAAPAPERTPRPRDDRSDPEPPSRDSQYRGLFGSRDGGTEFGSRDGGTEFGSRDSGTEFGSRDRGTEADGSDEFGTFGTGGDEPAGRNRNPVGFGDNMPSGDFDRDRFGRDRGTDGDAGESRALGGLRGSNADLFSDDEPIADEPSVAENDRAHAIPSTPAPCPQKHVYKPYRRPSVGLFHQYEDTVTVGQEEIERTSSIIVETLAGFRVDTEIMRVTAGPTVTRYDIDIPRNITVTSVTKRDREIAMRLHARDGVNMYSNNESGFISIEVPNSVPATVGLRSILQSEDYLQNKPSALTFAIGKDVEGRCICGNITKMKHILIAGATGSGKSVCLNAMLISLICKYSPEDLRLILIDPKKVEFAVYDGLPHLMINEIIADAQKAVTALNWAIKEMERRYELFEQKTRSGVVIRDLDEYNQNLTEDEQKLPKIVIVVDELADLMSVAKKDIEERIQRLTQKARAAGIHLVIATQRPSVDVITGVIKGNLPTRIAFRVIQEVDSRTILDESGAEKLLGNGDMLFRTEGMFRCSRVQGAFLSSAEVHAVVEEIKSTNEAFFDQDVAEYINKTEESGESGGEFRDSGSGEVDPLYLKALAIVVKLGQASISLITRKCSVGYNHAGKIIEWMEIMGYISPFDGKAKARAVLLTKEEYESKYGPLD